MAYTTIDNPELYFQVKLWSGDSSVTSYTLDGSEDMQPDMVWIKSRSNAVSHEIHDAVRGANYQIFPDTTAAETNWTNALTAFNSDGFTVGASGETNQTGRTYVAWCWKESADSGMGITAYTGNGSSDRTVSHGLSAVPQMVIVKNRAATENWQVYWNDGTERNGFLNINNAFVTPATTSIWGTNVPTSSVFYVGDDSSTNSNTVAYISYAFAPKQGFSKFGSYTGGSDPFVYLGFRPAFIMFKNASATENWRIIDNKRDTYNTAVAHLYPNLSNAGGSGASYSDYCDFLSNGFKIISGAGEVDGSGNTIIYMAFAEAPFVNSNGVPCNAR